jgi:hypothetical protein
MRFVTVVFGRPDIRVGNNIYLLPHPAEYFPQAAGMIEVTMTQYYLVHFSEVDTKSTGIMYHGDTLAGIQQYGSIFGLYQCAQPVFCQHSRAAGSVFTHRYYTYLQPAPPHAALYDMQLVVTTSLTSAALTPNISSNENFISRWPVSLYGVDYYRVQ